MSQKKIRITKEDVLLSGKHIGPELCADDFMREANPADPLERPCYMGKKYCSGYNLSSPERWPPLDEAAERPDSSDQAVVPREYYLKEVWQEIEKNGRLPKRRTACLFCKRFRAQRLACFRWLLEPARLSNNNENQEEEEEEGEKE